MVQFLEGRVSDRKLRLFKVACCRRVWDLLTDERSRRAVEVAEQFGDGGATEEQLVAAREAAWEHGLRLHAGINGDRDLTTTAAWRAAMASVLATFPPSEDTAIQGSVNAARAKAVGLDPVDDIYRPVRKTRPKALGMISLDETYNNRPIQENLAKEFPNQADLLRDIIGPLLFRPMTVDSSWLAWNGGTVVQLAQSIYEDRRFGHLPILGDALEEAGCTDLDILGHCRSGGDHVRGCWPIDLVLGKG
jgi:hypothetical protein